MYTPLPLRRWALACLAGLLLSGRPGLAGTWDFNGQSGLTKDKIQAFLGRAVTHFETASFRGFDQAEWLRTRKFLKDTGAKFIHGAELSWGRSYPDHLYWEQCKARLADLHATAGLKDVIVEGFIAEHIGSNADATVIPDWLWQEMEAQGINKTRTKSPKDTGGRHYFHYENFFQADWPNINRWGQGQSVPDITQTETKLYFRYLLREYIDAGFESIWFGGILLTGETDENNNALNELCTYARQYAAKHGRRGAVLFTSHCPGRMHDGSELLDYAAFPSRVRYSERGPAMEINTAHSDAGVRDLIGVIENMSDLPVLLEIDNYACAASPPIGSGAYDEITGFAAKPPQIRRAFLRKYYHEVRNWRNLWCNQRVNLALPGRRGICIATCAGHLDANKAIPYPTNWYSPYREHSGDEDTIAALFSGRLRAIKPAASAPAPAAAARPDAGPWLSEPFDAYREGDIAGQGTWTKDPARKSAVVQATFAKAGKALRIDAHGSSDAIEHKLTFPLQAGGTHRVSFDLAMVDNRPRDSRSEVAMVRMTLRNGLPNAELLPNSGLLLLYWGSRGRLVYQGNQSAVFLESAESRRWYHIDLLLDLDAMTVDLLLDGVSRFKALPLRDCESHSVGSLSLTGFVQNAEVQVYLDNLTGRVDESLPPKPAAKSK
jgi:hypothetical protein